MFSISVPVNLTISGTSTIELVSTQDMFYVNKNESVTIKFTNINDLKFNDVQKQSIKCKLGAEFIATKILGNDQFLCSFLSSVPKEVTISMVYRNEDAYNQEILLSTNTLPITFIGNLSYLIFRKNIYFFTVPICFIAKCSRSTFQFNFNSQI
jgi:hypothetical protein